MVRTTVIITLILLASAFGALFLHNWRLWDIPSQKSVKANNESDTEDEFEDDEESYGEIDPMLKAKLMQTRRKSVAFSVCVVDREKMTFDLDRKRVLLGLTRSTDRLHSGTGLPSLQENCETEAGRHHIPLILAGADTATPVQVSVT